MKLSYLCNILVLLLAFSCSPKNEEVKSEHVVPGPSGPVTDSVVNPEKDGTATAQTHQTPKLPLPQPALDALSKKYPGWREPVLLETPDQRAAEKNRGPLLIRGDFTGNTQQDIALQIRHERDIVIVALLQDSAGWDLHELKRDILFNERGTYKSLYYVYLTEAGAQVYDYRNRQNLQIENDAVSAGIDNSATTYVFENGAFQAYETGDR